MENNLLHEVIDELKAERDNLIKNKKVREIAAIIVGVLLLVGGAIAFYYHGKVKAKYEAELDLYALQSQAFTIKIQKDSSIKYNQEVVIGDERTAKQHALDEAIQYKDLYFSLKAKVSASVKNIDIPIKKDSIRRIEVPMGCDSIAGAIYAQMDSMSIPVGSSFFVSDKWYYFSGDIELTKLHLDSAGFKSGDISLTLGKEKAKWFKDGKLYQGGKTTTSLVVENPCFAISDMSSIKVEDKRKRPILLSKGAFFVYGIIVATATGTALLMAN